MAHEDFVIAIESSVVLGHALDYSSVLLANMIPWEFPLEFQ